MAHIIILAGNTQEANVYARKSGLRPSGYVAPVTARSVEGVVPKEVHILPGFRKRRDTHALMAAIKRSSRRYQGVKFVEIDERGPLTDRKLVVAHRYNALVDAGIPEDVDPVIAMASVQVTPEDILAEQKAQDAKHDATPEGRAAWAAAGVIVAEGAPVTPEDALDDLAQVATVLSNVEQALAESPEGPKRRASHCKVCNTKHIKGQDCPGPAIFE